MVIYIYSISILYCMRVLAMDNSNNSAYFGTSSALSSSIERANKESLIRAFTQKSDGPNDIDIRFNNFIKDAVSEVGDNQYCNPFDEDNNNDNDNDYVVVDIIGNNLPMDEFLKASNALSAEERSPAIRSYAQQLLDDKNLINEVEIIDTDDLLGENNMKAENVIDNVKQQSINQNDNIIKSAISTEENNILNNKSLLSGQNNNDYTSILSTDAQNDPSKYNKENNIKTESSSTTSNIITCINCLLEYTQDTQNIKIVSILRKLLIALRNVIQNNTDIAIARELLDAFNIDITYVNVSNVLSILISMHDKNLCKILFGEIHESIDPGLTDVSLNMLDQVKEYYTTHSSMQISPESLIENIKRISNAGTADIRAEKQSTLLINHVPKEQAQKIRELCMFIYKYQCNKLKRLLDEYTKHNNKIYICSNPLDISTQTAASDISHNLSSQDTQTEISNLSNKNIQTDSVNIPDMNEYDSIVRKYNILQEDQNGLYEKYHHCLQKYRKQENDLSSLQKTHNDLIDNYENCQKQYSKLDQEKQYFQSDRDKYYEQYLSAEQNISNLQNKNKELTAKISEHNQDIKELKEKYTTLQQHAHSLFDEYQNYLDQHQSFHTVAIQKLNQRQQTLKLSS